nr:putative disease resistance rpp13-like protein 1 [Quercus suber]
MGRKRDRFWDYAEELKGRFKCNYCKREFPGGASRIKSHLAGVKGRDIVICDVVPEHVQKEAYEATQATNKKLENASTSSKYMESTIASTSISTTIQKEKFVTQSEEEYMAEIVLNNVVDRLVTKAFSLAIKDNDFKWGFEEELKNISDTLFKIKVVLHQKRQVSDKPVRIWLMELRNVAYEVDNVLDEFNNEIIQQKVLLQNQMIDQLMHLRLLHISFEIEELPQSITKLYNLQTLRIEECPRLKKLPEDLSNLFNLRHINIRVDAIPTPKNMGRLTNLQTLSLFAVGPDEGFRIKELGPLMNLRGEIKIRNLEHVEGEEEAKRVISEKDEKVLEGLQPHPNLKSLTIDGYRGKKFPSWVGFPLYHNLIEIKLTCCSACEEVNLIPTLGHLPCLRVLEIFGMGKLRCIGSESHSYSDRSFRNTTTLFPALRILKLQYMRSLKEGKDADEASVFPRLEEFTITSCPELSYLLETTLHEGISLQKLVVDRCDVLKYLPGVPSIKFGVLTSLQSYIFPDEYLENEDWLHSTFSIRRSLQKLKLRESPHIFLDQIQYFTALKILWIEGFHEIEALTEWLGNLSSLQKLYIVDCENLVHLPSEKVMRRLTQLKTLIIKKCPKFEDNERSNISHIPFVGIQDDRDLSKLEF